MSLDSLQLSRSSLPTAWIVPAPASRRRSSEEDLSMNTSERELLKELRAPQAERSRADVLLEHPIRDRFCDSNGDLLRLVLENVDPAFCRRHQRPRRRLQRPGGSTSGMSGSRRHTAKPADDAFDTGETGDGDPYQQPADSYTPTGTAPEPAGAAPATTEFNAAALAAARAQIVALKAELTSLKAAEVATSAAIPALTSS